MKKIIMILLLLGLNLLVFSEDLNFDKEKEFIIETNKTKDYMLASVSSWFRSTFGRYNQGKEYGYVYDIIEINKEIGFALFRVNGMYLKSLLDWGALGKILVCSDFDYRIDFKDNKYKVTISNILIQEYRV